jgi:hypothetical protein
MSYVRYANRTCHDCGAIHPQNEMKRTTVTRESGRSKKTFSILDGNDKRRQDALWGLGGRTYYSKREVWVCTACSPEENFIRDTFYGLCFFAAVLILMAIYNFVSGIISYIYDTTTNFFSSIGDGFSFMYDALGSMSSFSTSIGKIIIGLIGLVIFGYIVSLFQKKDNKE